MWGLDSLTEAQFYLEILLVGNEKYTSILFSFLGTLTDSFPEPYPEHLGLWAYGVWKTLRTYFQTWTLNACMLCWAFFYYFTNQMLRIPLRTWRKEIRTSGSLRTYYHSDLWWTLRKARNKSLLLGQCPLTSPVLHQAPMLAKNPEVWAPEKSPGKENSQK